jgi:hypothetical protein
MKGSLAYCCDEPVERHKVIERGILLAISMHLEQQSISSSSENRDFSFRRLSDQENDAVSGSVEQQQADWYRRRPILFEHVNARPNEANNQETMDHNVEGQSFLTDLDVPNFAHSDSFHLRDSERAP